MYRIQRTPVQPFTRERRSSLEQFQLRDDPEEVGVVHLQMGAGLAVGEVAALHALPDVEHPLDDVLAVAVVGVLEGPGLLLDRGGDVVYRQVDVEVHGRVRRRLLLDPLEQTRTLEVATVLVGGAVW